MARPLFTPLYPLHTISAEGDDQVTRLDYGSVSKPSLVKLPSPKPAEVELDNFVSFGVRSRARTIEHDQGTQQSCTASIPSSRSGSSSSSNSQSIPSIIFTARHSRRSSYSTLLADTDHAFFPTPKLVVPTIELNGNHLDIDNDIARPYRKPKAIRSASTAAPCTLLHPALKPCPALQRTGTPKPDFFDLPLSLQRNSGILDTTSVTAVVLSKVASALLKWRLITFYADFLPSTVHQRAASDAKLTLQLIAEPLRKVDWLAFTRDLEDQVPKRTTTLYTRLLDYLSCVGASNASTKSSSHDRNTLARNIVLEAARKLCTEQEKHAPDPEAAAHARMLSSPLLTSIEAYGLLMQPQKRNLSARNLADMKDYARLGRILLEDLRFTALCREDQYQCSSSPEATPMNEPRPHVKLLLPILSAITAAIGRAQRTHFRELRYDSRRCKCGCISGAGGGGGEGEEVDVDGKKKQRIRYKLSDEVEKDLAGEASLMGEMRAQGRGGEGRGKRRGEEENGKRKTRES